MLKGKRNDDIIFGKHPVLEALESGRQLEKLLIQRPASSPEMKTIQHLARKQGVPVQFVPVQKLNSITRKNHQGVLAFVSLIPYYQIDDVIAHIYDNGETPLLMLLDGVTDVRNLGAIARSALCLGAHALVVPEKGGAMINADAMKASAGALNKLHVCKVGKLQQAIETLQQHGIAIAVATMNTENTVAKTDLSLPTAIVLGSEGEGVHPAIEKMATTSFSIPMAGDFDSLNVSVSAGIILYEALRQRQLTND